MINHVKTLPIAVIGLALASCAAPKATAVAEMPKEKVVEKPTESAPSDPLPYSPDDGLRLGDDILALPSDEQLRSTKPKNGDGDATVIARPPAE